MDKTTQIISLVNLSAVVAKLSKSVVLRLTREKMYMIEPSSACDDGILWCEIVVSSFFSEYFYEGCTPPGVDQEEIVLEMATSDFERAVRIERPDKMTPRSLKMKLSKESITTPENVSASINGTTGEKTNQPVLAIQLQLEQSVSGRALTLTRELKVRIVAKRFWAEYKEPTMPQFTVSLFMPSLLKLRMMADKLKSMGKHMIIRGSGNGSLQLRAKSSTMKISVNFIDCEKPEWEMGLQKDTNASSGESKAAVRIPTKKLLDFTAGEQLRPTRCILNMVDGELIHCILLLGLDVNLQFLIPHVNIM